jgi:hypothetical protein
LHCKAPLLHDALLPVKNLILAPNVCKNQSFAKLPTATAMTKRTAN